MTAVTFLEQDGRKAFAVLPYDEYEKLLTAKQRNEEFLATTIPTEVVDIAMDNDYTLLKAWRIYLGIKQKDLAEKVGITPAALSQMEKAENPHKATLKKLGKAMGVSPALLTEED